MGIFRHAREVSPYLFPNGNGAERDVHGLETVNLGTSQDNERVPLVGTTRECIDKSTPEGTVSLPLLERGEMSLFLTLANLDAEPVGGLTLLDFSGALTDYVQYERDAENGTVVSTTVLPQCALSSFSLELTADERITNTIEITNDNKHELNYDNLIYVHVKATSGVTGAYSIDTSNPTPSADPNNSGKYILRVDRLRSGTLETLTEDVDFTYDSTPASESVDLTAVTGDVYHVYYTSSDFGTSGGFVDPTSQDTDTPCFIKADSVTVLIGDGVTEVELDVLTTLSITASVENLDEAVIGTPGFAIREIDDTPVDVSIGGRIKDSTILEAFMGKLGQDHGITDINKYLDNVSVTVKIYSDSTKTTFLKGYKVTDLTFTGDTHNFTAGDFGELTVDCTANNLLQTASEGNL